MKMSAWRGGEGRRSCEAWNPTRGPRWSGQCKCRKRWRKKITWWLGTSLEPGARGVQMVELFVETEVAQIVEQSSFRKKQASFSYCLRKACFQ
jgi:hypothetical protein